MQRQPKGNRQLSDWDSVSGACNASPASGYMPGKAAGIVAKRACCGRGAFYLRGRDARINKTLYLFHARQQFLDHLAVDIEKLVRRASRESLIPAVRINGTSDLAWIAMEMSSRFPGVQFYGHTKLPKPELRISGQPPPGVFRSVATICRMRRQRWRPGINVAVVFDTPWWHGRNCRKHGSGW